MVSHPAVDLVEVHALASFVLLQLLGYETFKLVALVTDLVQVLICLTLKGVEEALRLKLRETLLDQVYRGDVFVLAEAKLLGGLLEKGLVGEELLLGNTVLFIVVSHRQ